MKTLITIITLMTLISFSCCTPDDPQADCKADPTCEYFECLVDGEKWTPSCTPDPLFGCDPFDVQYYKETGFLSAYISNDNISESINLFGINLKMTEKAYLLNKSSELATNNNSNCNNFKIDTSKINAIQFKRIDTINFILEGFLNFTSKDSCNKSKSITECNFRIKYRF